MSNQSHIVIKGLHQNNLKNISLEIPKGKIVVFTGVSGSGKSSIVFDTIAAAKSRGADCIILDTAGRLHNKKNLMDELSKISRVIERELPDSSVETLLVLDATTGQNAVNQAKLFAE